jgi:hypothetical protein
MLCAFMVAMFPLRHGLLLKMPILFERPQDVVSAMIHKLQNIKPQYFVALGLLLLENYVIYLTPGLPHKTALMHTIALYAFYGHFALICLYRTAILIVHLSRRELVREILMQSFWKTTLQKQPSVALEIVHAYATGMLTHIVYLVPWYLVIMHLQFSLVLLPLTAIAAFAIQRSFVKVINDWFYRDHWLSHNAELDFVYLHGPHHDAIPSGLIAVAGNGFLEGVLRGTIAFPTPFFNPIMAALFYTADVKIDIDSHQYIPGMFPKIARGFYEVAHHATHHFGRAEPYGFAINLAQPGISDETKKIFRILPDELKHSISLDEQLTGYEWDNSHHRWFLALVDKYQDTNEPLPRGEKT